MGLNPHCQGSNCLKVHDDVEIVIIDGKSRTLCPNCKRVELRNVALRDHKPVRRPNPTATAALAV